MSLNDSEFLRYSRQLLMEDVGESGQASFTNASILIVGLGGLGCPVATYLTAAGVGSIDLCDPDTVDLSNLQRQVLYTTDDCGNLKVNCAKTRLEALNSEVEINVIPSAFDQSILPRQYSVVVDCTDDTKARHLINRFCFANAVPLVSGAALGWEGQLIAFDFSQFRRLCFSCVVSENTPEPVINCANSGVLGPILGVVGSLQALTVLRILMGQFEQHGVMQRYDGKRGQWLSFSSVAVDECAVCG